MLRIGIVGMGVIGTAIAKAASGDIAGVTLAGVTVRDPAKAGGFPAYPLDAADRPLRPDRRGGHPGGAP